MKCTFYYLFCSELFCMYITIHQINVKKTYS